eukprot:TRINITY_DN75164_c0_g1_i1.p1 TRINITY_DN75164_c0_g1~~TRINITY_DN75164_c0_g1_i1.p1  ORF type:complete len:809 (+),score=70.47 TRINITY_DN75164_c0_g1_i1:57-2483(+)
MVADRCDCDDKDRGDAAVETPIPALAFLTTCCLGLAYVAVILWRLRSSYALMRWKSQAVGFVKLAGRGSGGRSLRRRRGAISSAVEASSESLLSPRTNVAGEGADELVGDVERRLTFLDYLVYNFVQWYAWTSSSQVIVVFSLSTLVVFASGIVGGYITGQPFGSAAWAAWVRLVSPDGGQSEETTAAQALGVLVSLAGMLLFALFISMVSENLATMLEGLKDGKWPVVESDHIVICGWNTAALPLVEELAMAARSRQDANSAIVVLSEQPKQQVEQSIQESGINLGSTSVCVRWGQPHLERDLHKVCAGSAHTLIVLTDDECPREERDSKTLQTLLMAGARTIGNHTTLVVQASLVHNRDLLQDFGGPQTEVVTADDYVGQLLVQCSRCHGLGSMLREFFVSTENRLCVHSIPELIGKTFQDAVFTIPNAVLIGVATCHGALLLPTPDLELAEGDEVIAVSPGGCKPEVLSDPCFCAQSYLRNERMLASEQWRRQNYSTAGPVKELLLMLGWNDLAATMLYELDNIVGKGSEIQIFSPTAAADRERFLDEDCWQRNYTYRNIKVVHVEGALGNRCHLERLPLQHVDAIYVLAEASAVGSPEDADGKTLSLLVQLRHILLGLDMARFPPIVPEIRCSYSERACVVAGVRDFIGSQRLVSKMIASVSVQPVLNQVYKEIMSAQSCSFVISPLARYYAMPPGLSEDEKEHRLPKFVTFYEVMARALSLGDVVLGWTIPTSSSALMAWTREAQARQAKACGLREKHEVNTCWEINPKNKMQKRAWRPQDRLVILSDGTTAEAAAFKRKSFH